MSTIDVAVPCYQYERFIADCIGSIASQNVDGLRILVFDNGSTDGSLNIAKDLARSDSRIEVRGVAHNQGQKFSYNACIDWASADYFMILDADDLLAEGALTRAVAVMDSDPGIAFCHGVELREAFAAGTKPMVEAPSGEAGWSIEDGDAFIHRLCLKPINPVGTSSVVMRTTAQKKAGYYNPALEHADDVEMWLRLARQGKVAETKAVQAMRRVHPHQMSSYGGGTVLRDCVERQMAYDAFFSADGRSIAEAETWLAQAHRSLASKAYWSALSHLARGRAAEGAALLKYALRTCPSMAVVPPIDWLLRMDFAGRRVADVLGIHRLGRIGAR